MIEKGWRGSPLIGCSSRAQFPAPTCLYHQFPGTHADMQTCTQANTSAHKTELLKDRKKSLRWHHGKTRNEHGTFHGDYSWEAWVKSFRDAECVWQGQELQSLLYRPPLDFYNMWYLKKTFMTDFFLIFQNVFPLLQIHNSCSQDHTPPRDPSPGPLCPFKRAKICKLFSKTLSFQCQSARELDAMTSQRSQWPLHFPEADNCFKETSFHEGGPVSTLAAPRESELFTSASALCHWLRLNPPYVLSPT